MYMFMCKRRRINYRLKFAIATYQLSKHLVFLLAQLVGKTPAHVKNSIDFASFISDQTLQQDQVLVSFDVVSLFTNVPVDLACRVAGMCLQSDESLGDHTMLSPDQILTLLRFCLNATYLAYRGDFYQQTFGTAMGSPISVTVADLVMEDIEERALTSFPSRPLFWKRYVDDTCTALRPDQLEAFHKHLNSIEPSINFTYEVEEDRKLPFLDILITHHPDGTLSTTVYRKRTHTNTSILILTTPCPTNLQLSGLCFPELTHTVRLHWTGPRNSSM